MKPLKDILATIRDRDRDNIDQAGNGFLHFVATVHFDGSQFFYPLAECDGCLREVTRIAEKSDDAVTRECAAVLLHHKTSNNKE